MGKELPMDKDKEVIPALHSNMRLILQYETYTPLGDFDEGDLSHLGKFR